MKRQLLLIFGLFSPLGGLLFGQNDKQVFGPQIISPFDIAQGHYIFYLIRFQNYGGDTARNLSVRDTLDPRLDATTFQMLDASHEHSIVRGGEIIRWYFNNIDLPAQGVDTSFSRGYIYFKVKPKDGLYPGQVIRNRASIYFDGQPLKSTNEVVVRIDDPGPTAEPGQNALLLFPNPNAGVFEVNADVSPDSDSHSRITDATGKIAPFRAEAKADGSGSLVFVDKLEPGVYFFQMEKDGVLRVSPFLVLR